jgi:hypothetical protein
MPARQRGAVVKRGPGNWQARYRDEDGQQRGQSGFETKSDARDSLDTFVRSFPERSQTAEAGD